MNPTFFEFINCCCLQLQWTKKSTEPLKDSVLFFVLTRFFHKFDLFICKTLR